LCAQFLSLFVKNCGNLYHRQQKQKVLQVKMPAINRLAIGQGVMYKVYGVLGEVC